MKYGVLFLSAVMLGWAFLGTPHTVQAASVCYYYNVNVGSTIPIPPGNVAPDATGNCPSYNGQPGVPVNSTTGTQGTSVANNLEYSPLEPIPGQAGVPSDFCGLLNLLFKVLIYLGGMLAVLFLVLGGITYMVSEVVDKRSVARERIKAALIGLLILLGTYLILYTINPNLVNACNVIRGTQTGVYYQPTSNTSSAQQIQKAQQDCRAVSGAVVAVPQQSFPNSWAFSTQTCTDLIKSTGKTNCSIIGVDPANPSTIYYCLR